MCPAPSGGDILSSTRLEVEWLVFGARGTMHGTRQLKSLPAPAFCKHATHRVRHGRPHFSNADSIHQTKTYRRFVNSHANDRRDEKGVSRFGNLGVGAPGMRRNSGRLPGNRSHPDTDTRGKE